MHAKRVRQKSRHKARAGTTGRRTNQESVTKALAAALSQVADRQKVFGVFLRVELEAGVGAGGIIVLRDYCAVRVRESEERVELRAEGAGGDFANELLVFVRFEFEAIDILGLTSATVDDERDSHGLGFVSVVVWFGLGGFAQIRHVERDKIRQATGCRGANFLSAPARFRIDVQRHLRRSIQVVALEGDLDRFAALCAERKN